MRLDCLVVRQPYASLIAFGQKRWEFRRMDSKKRGLIGIAASPNEPFLTKSRELNGIRYRLPRGAVLATAEMNNSFFVTSADLRSHLTDPMKVNLHGFEISTAAGPVGEPIEDIKLAIENKEWQSYAWSFENVVTLEKPLELGKLERSTWISLEVPTSGKEVSQ